MLQISEVSDTEIHPVDVPFRKAIIFYVITMKINVAIHVIKFLAVISHTWRIRFYDFSPGRQSSEAAVETCTVKIVMPSISVLKSSEFYQHPQDSEINSVCLGKTHIKGKKKIHAALHGICYLVFLQSVP